LNVIKTISHAPGYQDGVNATRPRRHAVSSHTEKKKEKSPSFTTRSVSIYTVKTTHSTPLLTLPTELHLPQPLGVSKILKISLSIKSTPLHCACLCAHCGIALELCLSDPSRAYRDVQNRTNYCLKTPYHCGVSPPCRRPTPVRTSRCTAACALAQLALILHTNHRVHAVLHTLRVASRMGGS
jgi:hypothetical protein